MRILRAVLIVLWASCAPAAGSNVPIFFAANRGEAPRAVRFMAKGAGVTAYFLRHEIQLHARGVWVHLQFAGASSSVRLEGNGPLPGRANFLVGSPSLWHRDVPTFGAVRYRNLYPGIDMIYGGEGARLKSEFVVAPGADPARIRIHYAGAGIPTVQPDGSLSIAVGEQRISEAAPYVYQERNGSKTPVGGRFTIGTDGSVGFSLGDYDRARPLIIDPLMTYSLIVGVANFNAATAIAVDSAGAAYIAGYTDSDALPTANPAQNYNAGSVSVFVAKLNPSGSALEYCTYMGGSQTDRAYGIAVDSSGAAYVTGATTSPNFPTRYAEQSSLEGSSNAFVFKLNPAGDALVFSTYLGGSGADTANGIVVDSSGNSYVVGDTTSLNFPATGFQTSNRGGQDAFAAKLSSNGEHLLFSTYLGGAGNDHGAAIAVDANGTAYLTGSTWSYNFPLENAFQSAIGGPCNAFLARLSSDGGTLMFSTYLGGSGCTLSYPETGQGIALDAQGDAYVAGVTGSSNFPLLNAVQPQLEGSLDAFVAEVNSSGSLLFSTYMGGSSVDVATAIALDGSGSVYVVGYTWSTDFPVTSGAIQAASAGQSDAFLFKLSPTGDTLLYATYLGGSGQDTASGVAVDSNGNVYFAGWTLSSNFPGVRLGN